MIVEHVLAAAEREWRVFPLASRGKIPAVKDDWEKRATVRLDTIERYWTEHPDANYGIACGPSRLLVIDIDVKWVGDEVGGAIDVNGHLAWGTLLAEHGAQVDTYTVFTPRGGEHVYFTDLEGRFRNTASRLAPGIDTRAVGGYVVGPGSVTDQGEYATGEDRPVADTPGWLASLLTRPTPSIVGRTVSTTGRQGGYSWAGLVAAVATAPEGTRNDRLFWAARQVADDYHSGRVRDPRPALDDIALAAARTGLEEREIARTIDSAFKAGAT
jgi:hypothetical protein